MTKPKICALFILLVIAPIVWGQQTLQSLDLSPVITSGFISNPVVVTNEFKKEWLVAWNQNRTVRGRVIQPDGESKPTIKLLNGTLYDAEFNSIDHTYLILYENNAGQLLAQLLSGTLKRKGTGRPVADPNKTTGRISSAQVVFDPVTKAFVVFWIELTNENATRAADTAIKQRILNARGKPISEANTVLSGGTTIHYDELRVTRNPQNGYLFLNVLQFSKGVGSILGYTFQSDGTLLRNKPVKFATQKMRNSSFLSRSLSVSESDFDSNGDAIATWAADKDDQTPTRFKSRQITSEGTSNSASKLFVEDDRASIGTSLVFDSGQNKFLAVWSTNEISGVLLDPRTGDTSEGPFTVKVPLTGPVIVSASSLDAAYENDSGNILIIWKTDCFDPFSNSCPGSAGRTLQLNGVIFSSQ